MSRNLLVSLLIEFSEGLLIPSELARGGKRLYNLLLIAALPFLFKFSRVEENQLIFLFLIVKWKSRRCFYWKRGMCLRQLSTLLVSATFWNFETESHWNSEIGRQRDKEAETESVDPWSNQSADLQTPIYISPSVTPDTSLLPTLFTTFS